MILLCHQKCSADPFLDEYEIDFDSAAPLCDRFFSPLDEVFEDREINRLTGVSLSKAILDKVNGEDDKCLQIFLSCDYIYICMIRSTMSHSPGA
jgi:hypothetical protein